MTKQVCVIGLGRFGAKVASALFQQQHEVLAIDRDERVVQGMLGQVTYVVEADATSESALRDLGVGDMDVTVISVGSQIQSSIIATMLVKTMGVPYVVARASDAQHAEILHRAGADKVVFPEEDAALRVANVDLNPNTIEYMGITERQGIHKLRPPEYMRGRTLREAGLGAAHGNDVVTLVLRRGREYILHPADDEVIGEGDVLVVAGSQEDVERTFSR